MSSQLVLQPDEAEGADTYLLNGPYASLNFGDTELMTVGTASISKVTVYSRALLRFDLRSLPPLAIVQSAVLTLSHADGGALTGPMQLKAYRATRTDWTEFGATWNQYDGSHAWTTAGGDFSTADHDTATVPATNVNVVFSSLKNLAIDAMANRGGFLNLLIVGSEAGSANNFITARSSSDDDPAARPKLVVTYDLPPSPVLAITDHADHTGASATISGLPAGTPVSIYVEAFGGNLGVGNWQYAGWRIGNGTLVLNLPVGHYFAYAIASIGGGQTISAVVYFVVSDGLESIHTRCLDSAQARIQLLALPGLDSERVIVEKLPTSRSVSRSVAGLPAVLLSPQRAAMPSTAGTTSLDDVHYDVLVTLLDRDNQSSADAVNLDRHLVWRERIARAFRNQRLPGVDEVIDTVVEPASSPNEEAWKQEYLASALLLRFVSRERRGF